MTRYTCPACGRRLSHSRTVGDFWCSDPGCITYPDHFTEEELADNVLDLDLEQPEPYRVTHPRLAS